MNSLTSFWAFVLVFSGNNVLSIPVLTGHFNAHAVDAGMSMVHIEKDVVLSPGRGGNNFNAEAKDNGEAVVAIGGAVHGFAANRTGEEFNAISKKKGTSQVRVNGDLVVENLDPSVRKFDAVAESQGKSLVQVGNVVIQAGSREARELENEAKRKPASETPWGAAAVADHNSRPWETVNHGSDDAQIASHDPPASEKPEDSATIVPIVSHGPQTTVGIESTTDSAHLAPQSNLNPSSEKPEIIVTSSLPTTDVTTPTTTVGEISQPHTTETVPGLSIDYIVGPRPNGGYSPGSLNAVSNGQGSKSVVLVKGFVQY